MLKQSEHVFIPKGHYMLYQDYLSIIQRTELIEKQKEIYEKERKRYEEEFKKNPNYKLVYHSEHHL